jgi:hypothetical protein
MPEVWSEVFVIDDKGRCCGRKPFAYKSTWSTSLGPHRFCARCDRAYDLKENRQIGNWAWRQLPNGTWEPNPNKPMTEGSAA